MRVTRKSNESNERLLKRFMRDTQEIVRECKRRRRFMTKRQKQKYKKKQAQAKKKQYRRREKR